MKDVSALACQAAQLFAGAHLIEADGTRCASVIIRLISSKGLANLAQLVLLEHLCARLLVEEHQEFVVLGSDLTQLCEYGIRTCAP